MLFLCFFFGGVEATSDNSDSSTSSSGSALFFEEAGVEVPDPLFWVDPLVAGAWAVGAGSMVPVTAASGPRPLRSAVTLSKRARMSSVMESWWRMHMSNVVPRRMRGAAGIRRRRHRMSAEAHLFRSYIMVNACLQTLADPLGGDGVEIAVGKNIIDDDDVGGFDLRRN